MDGDRASSRLQRAGLHEIAGAQTSGHDAARDGCGFAKCRRAKRGTEFCGHDRQVTRPETGAGGQRVSGHDDIGRSVMTLSCCQHVRAHHRHRDEQGAGYRTSARNHAAAGDDQARPRAGGGMLRRRHARPRRVENFCRTYCRLCPPIRQEEGGWTLIRFYGASQEIMSVHQRVHPLERHDQGWSSRRYRISAEAVEQH